MAWRVPQKVTGTRPGVNPNRTGRRGGARLSVAGADEVDLVRAVPEALEQPGGGGPVE